MKGIPGTNPNKNRVTMTVFTKELLKNLNHGLAQRLAPFPRDRYMDVRFGEMWIQCRITIKTKNINDIAATTGGVTGVWVKQHIEAQFYPYAGATYDIVQNRKLMIDCFHQQLKKGEIGEVGTKSNTGVYTIPLSIEEFTSVVHEWANCPAFDLNQNFSNPP